MSCLETNDVLAFLEGGLDAAQQQRIEQHLDGCSECRAVCAAVSKLHVQDPALTATLLPPRVSAWCRRGEVIAGKYRIERELGTGGMGVVVAATHTQLEQPVALKFMHPETLAEPEAKSRFLHEARASAKLRGEHVVRVFDVDELAGGVPYIVMELLEGQDLSALLAARGRLEVGEAASYLLQAADAVGQAHGLGLVHRDLKPSNIFLAQRPDGSTVVKVLDFGIAKSVDSGLHGVGLATESHILLGSPVYMSPEQFSSPREIDGRTDVWALGCVLHELLSGEPPFARGSLAKVTYDVMHTPVVPLRQLRPELPAALEKLVLGCLQKDREQRPSLDEMRAVLRAAAQDTSDTIASPVAPTTLDAQQTVSDPVGSPSPSRRGRRVAAVVAGLAVVALGLIIARAATSRPTPPTSATTTAAPVAPLPTAETASAPKAAPVVIESDKIIVPRPARATKHHADPFARK